MRAGPFEWSSQGKTGAGIFVNDIMDAVPIDKYFELFKPGQGGEGGFIRIGMDYVKSLKDRDGKSAGGTHPLSPKQAIWYMQDHNFPSIAGIRATWYSEPSTMSVTSELTPLVRLSTCKGLCLSCIFLLWGLALLGYMHSLSRILQY